MKRRSVLAAGALFCMGCGLVDPDNHFVIDGRIVSALGCQTLSTTDKMYELHGLPPEFQVEGLQVHMEVRHATEQVSTCMVGEIVDVVSVQRR